jgi:hypothetical protein
MEYSTFRSQANSFSLKRGLEIDAEEEQNLNIKRIFRTEEGGWIYSTSFSFRIFFQEEKIHQVKLVIQIGDHSPENGEHLSITVDLTFTFNLGLLTHVTLRTIEGHQNDIKKEVNFNLFDLVSIFEKFFEIPFSDLYFLEISGSTLTLL